jgi:acyl-CoA reductase-like NAD-dependent aldehyde dehydrogenase
MKSINPSDLSIVGELPNTTLKEIDNYIAKAKAAQVNWANVSLIERKEILVKAHKEVSSEAERIGKIIHQEMGKPLSHAIGEVSWVGDNIEDLCNEIIEAITPTELNDGRVTSTVHHDPLGVIACITPWNFPFAMAYDLLVPSLMTGNTVLFKPSEETFLTGHAYFEILQKHLPQDVLHCIIGDGAEGQYLVQSDVQLISFVGSKATGQKILGSASEGIKRTILEMGGKDPLIILPSANLDKAAKFAAKNSFTNSGQVCVSTEKILIDKNLTSEFYPKLIEHTEKIKIGPMVNKKQRDIVLAQVKDALAKGAEIIYGSEEQVNSIEDNFITPIILKNVNPSMDIYQKETFGPVACVIETESNDQALKFANDTEYGLGAVVFGDIENKETKEVARKLNSGMIGINKSCGGSSGTPWVGANQSGLGFIGSIDGHKQFTQIRIVSF